MLERNIEFQKLAAATPPTVTSDTTVIICETSDGKLWKVDSNGAIPLAFYNVGDIYISANPTSPASIYGGTWVQITDDAYLKIVTSSAGTVGGTSSDHRIPLSSMKDHVHNKIYNSYGVEVGSYVSGSASGGLIAPGSLSEGTNIDWLKTGSAGGGNPYYPYYYGVYAWKRIA